MPYHLTEISGNRDSEEMRYIALRAALENSTSMMEAMMVQMHSWEIEPVVNVRGQMGLNRKLLGLD